MHTVYTRKNSYATLKVLAWLILVSSCEKDNTNLPCDITAYQWQLQYIRYSDQKIKVVFDDLTWLMSYVLYFTSDSTYNMSTSANSAGGRYSIPNSGSIQISSYSEHTEVGASYGLKRIDKKLLKTLPTVSSYQIHDNRLYLLSEDGIIKLKRIGFY